MQQWRTSKNEQKSYEERTIFKPKKSWNQTDQMARKKSQWKVKELTACSETRGENLKNI